MKKLILCVTCVLLLASTVWSAPFLVCDCQDDFQGNYVLIFDGGAPIIADALQYDCPAGQVRVNLDMAPLGLADGQHSMEGYAKNVWGESIHVPFDFSKVAPQSLTGIGLSATP